MSFGDLYTVQPGQGNPPGLPPVDLPTVPRRPARTSITVGPASRPDEGIWGGHEDFKSFSVPAQKENDEGIWAVLPDHSPETELAARQTHFRDVGAGEAFARSAGAGATFGLEPAIEGVVAAGRKGNPDFVDPTIRAELEKHGLEPGDPLGSLTALVRGLGKLGYEHLIARAAGEGTEDYRKGRDEAQKALDAGREQHPAASFAGEMAGALAVPVPGLVAAAAPARIARGAAFGAAGGAAYGAGSGISEGKDAAGIAKKALVGGGLGAVTGGVFGGVLGPRAQRGPATRGERAAEFADQVLDAPIPRGLASDNTAINATTAKIRSVPVIGSRIGNAVDATQRAAGEHIGDIAGQLGGLTDRAAADAVVRPGLEHVVDANRATIDAAYNGVRGAIDVNRRFAMPRTQRALQDIRQARAAAGWPNPSQGLEQFENVASGATFNGAHRARVDAREAGNGVVPHPGYNAADYNRLTRAMTGDLRQMVASAARGTGGQAPTTAQRGAAVHAFDQAETEFGRLAEQNGILRRLIESRGEGAIATLLNASKEKGGNVALLAQLRNSMTPADFNTIGGLLLHELGHNNQTGEFSLAKFATQWDKVAPRARGILFSPQHLANIEQIVGLGSHIKSALRESNNSHTAGVLILFDLARDAILLGASTAAGTLSGATVPGGAAAAPALVFAHWLASPARASSMAAWSRARVGVLNHPTPARLGAFNIAVRNLSNNLGIPLESLTKRLTVAKPPEGSGAENDQPK
jgi:hypothetical protein